MLVAAAFVPIPPLLVPEIAGGSAAADAGLRSACHDVTARLLDAGLDEVVVVGPAAADGPVDGGWDWRGFGVAVPEQPAARRLPLGLAIGSWLLDHHDGAVPPRRHHGVSAASTAAVCAALGQQLAASCERVGLLVCGDGSACRSEKAPGYFDASAQLWDASAVAALRAAERQALLALDAAEATRLLAVGRAPWQVLAGAAEDAVFEARIDWADAPYGVMYVAGTWIRQEAP